MECAGIDWIGSDETQGSLRESDDRLHRKLKRAAGGKVLEAIGDPAVIEILLNEDGRLWVECVDGKMRVAGDISSKEAMSLISTVAASLNMAVTPLYPVVEGILELNGLRFEGIVPPVVKRPVFSIRKHHQTSLRLSDYVDQGALDRDDLAAIERAIDSRSNILISGGTGSGKTTFARAVLRSVAERSVNQRVVIIEDTPELHYDGENFVALKVSPGAGAQELLRATMRLRPDRIVVGEVRGGEALTLLKAWNTGHPGGVSTIHANSARSALTRLEQLVAEVSVMPVPHIIGDAIDLIVHLERSAIDGVRRVVEVLAVEGYGDGEYLVTPIERVKR